MKRRESREVAFTLIFEWSFRQDESMDEVFQQAADGREVEADDFAVSLCHRTAQHVEELDSLIQQYSDKWKINRLSKVTLSVLRMSICELRHMTGIPAGATINEAVELMKKYATEDEAAYVNGILGAYVRREKAGEAPEDAAEEPGEAEPEPEAKAEPAPQTDAEAEAEVETVPETEA